MVCLGERREIKDGIHLSNLRVADHIVLFNENAVILRKRSTNNWENIKIGLGINIYKTNVMINKAALAKEVKFDCKE